MDNALYVGLSRQMTLRREFDLLANNIANADTVGFKTEALMLDDDPERPKSHGIPSKTMVTYVLDTGVARDFGQGAMKQTGSPFDLALSGDGFFKVNAEDGERFTRDGQFTLDSTGRLTTAKGAPVQSADGGDILLDPTLGAPHIAGDGAISQDGKAVGRVGVFRFADRSALSKTGDGLYRNTANIAAEQANDAKVTQGSVEESNVQSILQMTRLIDVSRSYEATAKMIDNIGALTNESITRLGRVQ